MTNTCGLQLHSVKLTADDDDSQCLTASLLSVMSYAHVLFACSVLRWPETCADSTMLTCMLCDM